MGKKKGAEVSPLLHPGRTAGPTLMRRGGSCRVSKVIAVSVHTPTLRGRGRGVKVCTVRRGRPPPTPLQGRRLGHWGDSAGLRRATGRQMRGNASLRRRRREKARKTRAISRCPRPACVTLRHQKTLISRTKSHFFAFFAFAALQAAPARANCGSVTSTLSPKAQKWQKVGAK